MKKRSLWIIISAVLVFVIGIGTTLAILLSSSKTIENTFTVGKVSISLSETTGSEYKMAPGVEIFKDPSITVEAGSDPCWLFVQVQKTFGFDEFCSFEIIDSWIPLPQNEGFYYKKVERTAVNRRFEILKNDRIFVKDTVTEEELLSVTQNPQLKFTAYAIQSEGLETALDAWHALNKNKEE